LLDITIPIPRIYETFIGNNHVEPKKERKMKSTIQAGRGTSTIKTAKPIVHETFAKPKKAWFKQLRRIYAIDFAIYGNKLHAQQVSKSYRKSFELAKAKITQLEETQRRVTQ